jgi:hypothetical protein
MGSYLDGRIKYQCLPSLLSFMSLLFLLAGKLVRGVLLLSCRPLCSIEDLLPLVLGEVTPADELLTEPVER